MNNKGNTIGIVLIVLAGIALLWFLTAGKSLTVSRPNPNTITASAVSSYNQPNPMYVAQTSRTYYPSYPTYPTTAAYVTYPIASSSSSSQYSTYYPTNTYTNTNTYYSTRNDSYAPVYVGPPAQQGGCYVGGCSNQLCTDNPSAISTCEYQPQYACYSRARCERQANGACGWTLTPEFYGCVSGTY